MKTKLLATLISALMSTSAWAESDDELGSLSLDDLLSIKVTVASGDKGMTLRESPGIVTLITKDEIVNSGARDLMDVLNLVPGISFGMDVQGVVGIAARGNWAHEGKILLMVDGQEMNELSFATLQFGNHFPVENIERIEMIRGPGSAIYGGFAELGVIKITTKAGSQTGKTEFSALTSQMKDSSGRTALTAVWGTEFEAGSFDLNAYWTQGNRSDRDMVDFYPEDYEMTYNMEDNSELNDLMVNLSIKLGGFSARYLRDQYHITQRDIFFVNAPYPVEQEFNSDFIELKYKWSISESFSITPEYNLKKQEPWKATSQGVIDLEDPDTYEDEQYSGQYFDPDVQRETIRITASWDWSDDDNLIFGASRYEDDSEVIGKDYDPVENPEDIEKANFDNTAIFAQALMQTDSGNYTFGFRSVDHSEAGSSFLPRLGYTNVWDKFHFKALWSKAFRAPVVQNIIDFRDEETGATSIKPETTTVTEFEFGYQLSSNLFLTTNLYDIVIEDPIVYYFDGADAYRNYDEVGTRGIEMELKYKQDWGYLNFGFSHYQVSDNQVDQYAVLNEDFEVIDDDQLMGFPQQKLTLNAHIKMGDNWSINPSIIYESKKWAYTAANEEDSLVPEKLDAMTLVNVNIIRKFGDKFDLHFGVYNMFDDDVNYVQPYYDGYHAPLPGPTREIYLKGRFHF